MAEKQMTFDELSRELSTYVLDQFITEGGKGFRSAVRYTMVAAIQWKEEQLKREKEKK